MSQFLRESIGGRLTGDSALVALVDIDPNDPDGAAPAMFAATRNEADQPERCLTYRLREIPDNRFGSDLPLEDGEDDTSRYISDYVLEVEYWTRSSDTAPLESVRRRLRAIFHNRVWNVSGAESGRVLDSKCEMADIDHWDKTTNEHFGLFRFRLRYSYTPAA